MDLEVGRCEILFSYWLAKRIQSKNLSKFCVSRTLNLHADLLKKSVQFPHCLHLSQYGLEFGKPKTFRTPKHIGEKIDFNIKQFRFSNFIKKF
jgi:hypothetical protein